MAALARPRRVAVLDGAILVFAHPPIVVLNLGGLVVLVAAFFCSISFAPT